MNRTASLLGGLLCLGLAGYLVLRSQATEPAPTDAPPVDPPPAGLVADPPVFDLGTVGQQEQHTARFTLTNRHPHPVTFGVIAKSCSCTTAELTDPTLQPGQATTLSVLWKSGSRQGRAMDRLTVTYQSGHGAATVPGSVVVGLASEVLPDLLPAVDTVPFVAGRAGEFILRFNWRPGVTVGRLIWAGTTHPCLTAEPLPGELAVQVRYDGSPLDVAGGQPEVQIQAAGAVQSHLTVPVRIGP